MKRALVTGGSGDLGAAICKHLAQDGLHIIVHSFSNVDKARSTVLEIISQGGSAEAASFDITDSETTRTAIERLLENDPIQVVVNNAGVHADATFAGMSVSQWRNVIDVNLHGFYNVTHPLLLPMISSRWGRIVNISSVAGVLGSRGQVNYAATKAALHGASKSLAIELGSRGITVNVVAPGIIAGEMTKNSFTEEQIKFLVPMKRTGHPDEIAAVVRFLCSDEASYVSGQVIGVNGAMA